MQESSWSRHTLATGNKGTVATMSHDVPGPSHSKLIELNELCQAHGVAVVLTGRATAAVDAPEQEVTFAEDPDRFCLRDRRDGSVTGVPYLDPDTGSEVFAEQRIRELAAAQFPR